jgi:hypothetical protein
MIYKCPKCGAPIERGYSNKPDMIESSGISLSSAVFGSFDCKKCGRTARYQFPKEVRLKATGGKRFLILASIVFIIGLILLLSNK